MITVYEENEEEEDTEILEKKMEVSSAVKKEHEITDVDNSLDETSPLLKKQKVMDLEMRLEELAAEYKIYKRMSNGVTTLLENLEMADEVDEEKNTKKENSIGLAKQATVDLEKKMEDLSVELEKVNG